MSKIQVLFTKSMLGLCFGIVVFISFASNVFAQVTPIPPQGGPDGTWCIPDRVAIAAGQAGARICGYTSPENACAANMVNFYPQDTDILRSVRSDGSSVTCETDQKTILSRQRLWIGNPGGLQLCKEGVPSGGQCTQNDKSITDTCTSGGSSDLGGNPIDLLSGIKIQNYQDFSTSDGRFTFSRSYASRQYGTLYNNSVGALGRGWSVDMFPRMSQLDVANRPTLFLPGSQAVRFQCDGGNCRHLTTARFGGGSGRVRLVSDAAFSGSFATPNQSMTFADKGGVQYTFRSSLVNEQIIFRLTQATYPGGYSISFTNRLVNEQLRRGDITVQLSPLRYVITSATDSFGRVMSFQYSTETWEKDDGNGGTHVRQIWVDGEQVDYTPTTGPLRRVTFPDLSSLEFTYDSTTDLGAEWGLAERLRSSTRFAPNGIATPNVRTVIESHSYLYEKPRQSYALTGMIDSAGVRYASWDYDEGGLAISSEHAGGVDRYGFDYDITVFGGIFRQPTVTETNPLGRQTIYRSNFEGRYFETIEGQASNQCVADARSVRNFPSFMETIDREGRQMRSEKNGKGWVTSKVEARGTSDQVITTTEWHPTYKLPTRRTTPGLIDERVYDAFARLEARTLTDITAQADASRTWTFGYDTGPNVTSIDGPLPGPSDTRFYQYSGANLISMTNEVGHVTQYLDHNPIGAPGRIIDANGVETLLEYDSEHKLVRITEAVGLENAVTQIGYNLVDQITSILQPNGSGLSFEYDDARRLMAIENTAGERLVYTRNNAGGVTSTTLTGTDGGTEYFAEQIRDERNRILQTLMEGGESAQSVTQIAYDRESNPTDIIDPRGNTWANQFDNLDRLVKETDPLGAETDYGLSKINDARNPLSSVTDARDITTSYIRNGYGEVVQEISAERGGMTYVRDERGLVTQMTDARGVVTAYTYDAAGRLLSEDYVSASNDNDDVTYVYDQGPFGVGQLTAIVEGFGRTDYGYNSLGFLTSETRVIGSQTYATTYAHDLAGEVLQTIYPTGTSVALNRDNVARVTGITVTNPSTNEVTTVLANATYKAFGPISGADMGDGHNLRLSYDTAYRAKTLSRIGPNGALMDIGFEHDDVGDITAMNDNVRPERSQSFTYDPVSRLTQAQGGYGQLDYNYNLVGDRLQKNVTPIDPEMDPFTEDYSYDADTARLFSVSLNSTPIRDFGYAPSGQILQDTRQTAEGERRFDFDLNAWGRMVAVRENDVSVASYTYDVFEQRVAKSLTGQAAIHYHYDNEGRLISETDAATGAILRDYIWIGLMPVATLGVQDVPANDNCDPALIADLRQRLADREERLVLVRDRIDMLTGTVTTREEREAEVAARRAALQATLDSVPDTNTDRIDTLTTRIANLDARLMELDAAIDNLNTRIEDLNARVLQLEEITVRLQDRITRLETRCQAAGIDPNTGQMTDGSGGTTTSQVVLSYLHADHLGRPAFATDTAGTIIWDGGITTPFGMQIETMGAVTQSLMFPGQYQDEEMGLYQNWHRMYDPTLGRYLQSDMIGLAGGLNRYAYVGGSPINYVDPTGEVFFVPILIGIGIGLATDLAFQYFENGMSFNCLDYRRLAFSGALGAFGGGTGAFLKNGAKKAGAEWSHAIAKRNVDRFFPKGSKMNKVLNKKGGINGTWVSPERHHKHDFWRRVKGMTNNDKWHPSLRFFDRTPDYIKSSVLVPLAGQTMLGSDCDC